GGVEDRDFAKAVLRDVGIRPPIPPKIVPVNPVRKRQASCEPGFQMYGSLGRIMNGEDKYAAGVSEQPGVVGLAFLKASGEVISADQKLTGEMVGKNQRVFREFGPCVLIKREH